MVIWLNCYIVEGAIASKSVTLSPKNNIAIFNAPKLELIVIN